MRLGLKAGALPEPPVRGDGSGAEMVRVVLLVAGHRYVDRVLKRPSRVLELARPAFTALPKGIRPSPSRSRPSGWSGRSDRLRAEPGALDRQVEAAGDPTLEQAGILHQALAQLVELLERAIIPVPAAVSQADHREGMPSRADQHRDQVAAHAEPTEQQGEVEAGPFAG